VLRVHELTLAYDVTPVLERASLAVEAGQFVSLVGPSGSGKSTLLRAVIGLQAASAGRIETSFAKNEIGILFQDDALLPWRSALENVTLGLRLKGIAPMEATEIARSWLGRLDLKGLNERYPRELSGGQRKRVALAHLDAIVRLRVSQDLVRLVDSQHISVLLVTHDLEEALALSDRVYLLSQGPRAHISADYSVDIPRPRDVMQARTHPGFAPLLAKLWRDLSLEVGRAA